MELEVSFMRSHGQRKQTANGVVRIFLSGTIALMVAAQLHAATQECEFPRTWKTRSCADTATEPRPRDPV
jgi:hypothetical protein